MNKQELNQRYTDACAEIGHLYAINEQNQARTRELMALILKINEEMVALSKFEQAAAKLVAEAKAKEEAAKQAAPELTAVK